MTFIASYCAVEQPLHDDTKPVVLQSITTMDQLMWRLDRMILSVEVTFDARSAPCVAQQLCFMVQQVSFSIQPHACATKTQHAIDLTTYVFFCIRRPLFLLTDAAMLYKRMHLPVTAQLLRMILVELHFTNAQYMDHNCVRCCEGVANLSLRNIVGTLVHVRSLGTISLPYQTITTQALIRVMRTEGTENVNDWSFYDDQQGMAYHLLAEERCVIIDGEVRVGNHPRQPHYSASLWKALVLTDMLPRSCNRAALAIASVSSIHPPSSSHVVRVQMYGKRGWLTKQAKELGPLQMPWVMLLVGNAMLQRYDEDRAAGVFQPEQAGDWPDDDVLESLEECIGKLRHAMSALPPWPQSMTPPARGPLHADELEVVVERLPKIHVTLDAGVADALMIPVPSGKQGELWFC